MKWRGPLVVAILVFTVCIVLGLSFWPGKRISRAKIEIAGLLDPARRMAAFHRYVVEADPAAADRFSYRAFERFAEDRGTVEVEVTPKRPDGGPLYLVSMPGHLHQGRSSFWLGEGELAQRLLSLKPGGVRVIRPGIECHVFRQDGTPLLPLEGITIGKGVFGDFNQDGQPELFEIEHQEFPVDGAPPRKPLTLEYAKITDLNRKPIFAVLFGGHPEGYEDVEPWGCELVDSNGHGMCEVRIGPFREEGIESRAVFRWDAVKRTWAGSEGRPGDHFRVLNPRSLESELQKLANAGGLKEAVRLTPLVEEMGTKEPFVPTAEMLKSYHYESLAKLTDDELAKFMSFGRCIENLRCEMFEHARRVAGFWEMPPRKAALAYIHANRPTRIRGDWRFVFDDLDGKPAPDDGTMMIADGPSGCGSPSGSYITFLRCSRGESFLVMANCHGGSSWYSSPLRERNYFDLRYTPLSFDEARHILQTFWWMARARSLDMRDGMSFTGWGSSSTSDGFAKIEMATNQGEVKAEGTRIDRSPGRYAGCGDSDEHYSPVAFLNLAVQLFDVEIPERLGKRWTSQAPGGDWCSGGNATPTQRQQLQKSTAELIRLVNEGKLPTAIVGTALKAVTEFGFTALRPEVNRMVERLTSPSPAEQEAILIDQQIHEQVRKLGPKGTAWSDYRERASAIRDQAEKLGTAHGSPAPPPQTNARFSQLDALYERWMHRKTDYPGSLSKATFREELRLLDARDDPDALERYAIENDEITEWACTRLMDMGQPRRAEAVLRYWLKTGSPRLHRWLLIRALVEMGAKLEDEFLTPVQRIAFKKEPLSSADVLELMRLMRDSLEFNEFELALQKLVPRENPINSNPEIDQVLTSGLEKHTRVKAQALARRLGGKAWDRLVWFSQFGVGSDRLEAVLPSLVAIAQREPEAFRPKLLKVLVAGLKNSGTGYNTLLDSLLWNIWIADVRELKPEIERLATSGPEAVQFTRTKDSESPVNLRLHLARQIAAVWNEEDPLTRAKLAIALCMEHYCFDEQPTERLVAELRTVLKRPAAMQVVALRAFLSRYDGESYRGMEGRKAYLATVRGELERLEHQ